MGGLNDVSRPRRHVYSNEVLTFCRATTQGLTDGGLAGLIWSYVWTLVGFSFVMASLAEMASMAP